MHRKRSKVEGTNTSGSCNAPVSAIKDKSARKPSWQKHAPTTRDFDVLSLTMKRNEGGKVTVPGGIKRLFLEDRQDKEKVGQKITIFFRG